MEPNWYFWFDVYYKFIVHYLAPPLSEGTKDIPPEKYFDELSFEYISIPTK